MTKLLLNILDLTVCNLKNLNWSLFCFTFKHVVQGNVVGGSSVIGLTLVIADSKQDMPGIKPGPPGWHTSALTNELQEE